MCWHCGIGSLVREPLMSEDSPDSRSADYREQMLNKRELIKSREGKENVTKVTPGKPNSNFTKRGLSMSLGLRTAVATFFCFSFSSFIKSICYHELPVRMASAPTGTQGINYSLSTTPFNQVQLPRCSYRFNE